MNGMNHDAIIDRVARGMTEGEPSARFRARVLQRLPPVRRGSWLRIAIPAAVMTMGVLWMLVGPFRSAEPSRPAPRAAAANTPAPSVGTTTPAAIADASLAPRRTADAPAPAGPANVATSTGTDPAAAGEPAEPEGPRLLEPLSVPAPIVIEPIQPIAPSITPITVDPIVVRSTPPAPVDPRAGGSQRAPLSPAD